MNIFEDDRLHPDEEKPIKMHYSGVYDSVFVAFSPFFTMKATTYNESGRQKSHTSTLSQLKSEINFPDQIAAMPSAIYSYQNDGYPSVEDILSNGETVSWEAVMSGCGFHGPNEINKALKTSIGAYRQVFARTELAERLKTYALANNIYYPTEGNYQALTKKQILNAFRTIKQSSIVIVDEFYENTKELNISIFSDKEFYSAVDFKDYYIYDIEHSLLFSIGWDDFFFLIYSNKANVHQIVSTCNFEGFYCTDDTTSSWEFTLEEIEAGQKREQGE